MLSLCMIVKNEENDLPRCLDSVKDIVDEMIIVDTGSTDSTLDVIKSYDVKPYFFEWNDNFSDARNYSLDKATGDWILLMDADDELESEDKQSVLDLIKDSDADAYFFETICYVGENKGVNELKNLNVRLIRNNKDYRFTGAIHEQIASNIDKIKENAKILTSPIRVYHYGYMDKNIEEKNKRERNIKILKKELESDPKNTFLIFSMGNEYYALNDYNKALEYYKESYEKFNPNIGFSSTLVIRISMSYEQLGLYKKALNMIEEGLRYYPKYTDLVYLKGCILNKLGRYTLAINCFYKCIVMGKPPAFQSFIVGVEDYKSYYALSEIYFELGDYDQAYKYCIETLKVKPSSSRTFYRIAEILLEKESDIEIVKYKLEQFFAPNIDAQTYLVLADIFMEERKYLVANDYVISAEKLIGENGKTNYLKGVCLFYTKKYNDANKLFDKIKSGKLYKRAIYYRILCELLSGKIEKATELLKNIRNENSKEIIIYSAFIKILDNKKCEPICIDEKESYYYLKQIFDLLNTILRLSEFETFEKSLQLLNLIESDQVLLALGKIYYINGFFKLAYKELIKSIKIFEKIDYEGIEMMRKCLRK